MAKLALYIPKIEARRAFGRAAAGRVRHQQLSEAICGNNSNDNNDQFAFQLMMS